MLKAQPKTGAPAGWNAEAQWLALRPLQRVVLLAAQSAETRGGKLVVDYLRRPEELEQLGLVRVNKRDAGWTVATRWEVELTDAGHALAQCLARAAVGDVKEKTRQTNKWGCLVCGHFNDPPKGVPSGGTLTGANCANCRCSYKLAHAEIWTAEFLSVEVAS